MGIQVKGKLILASASPRRSEFLRLIGLDFETMPSSVEESQFAGESPEQHVLRLAAEKASSLAERFPEAWVIGADTVVFNNGELLGKPATIEDAGRMLRGLSGREHHVYTGFAVVCKVRGVLAADVSVSSVSFRDVSDEEVDWYVHTDEPYDKAGGYALQGRGAVFIREVRGSYTNIIGLPLCEIVSMLVQLKAVAFTA